MRSFSVLVLVVLATLLAPLAIATTWVTARVDDRQEYVDTVGPLADDPDVRSVMADAAAAAAVDALQQYVPVGLPSAVEKWARAAAGQVVESPDFPSFWRTANRDLHGDVIALLEDPDADTSGMLTVDASPLVAQVLLVLEERGIPVGLLPVVPLDVPVVERAKVAEAGPTYRTTHDAAGWLPLAWAVLAGLAVLLARGWRGRVRTAGLALLGGALGAGLVVLAVGPLTDLGVERAEVDNQAMVRVMLDAVLGSLSPYARTFLLAAPVGAVLVAASLWPRRERYVEEAPDWAHEPLPR
ncbi:hypothetical protein L615_000200000090 [Nocardioides sp. J9]|uniref:hypothetical protein n=1 Tax=Nocardioides sp. J9 TaxID=935844 RepID=UPI0011AAB2A7|nr:hypothetical protein [Nocardioides sp. J9]TWH00799.1 hypothetical protein L615_000200000090 [Nocardioides sp. J9]